MNALEVKPDPGAVRAWARKNGIPVSKTGKLPLHVRECYLEANPGYDVDRGTELRVRNERPDLFALADDMVEAELIRTGQLTLEPAQEPQRGTTDAGVTNDTPVRSLAEWLTIRDELADTIAAHAPQGVSVSFREVAEALLVQGWMKNAAA
ncbi:Lsr2 family protein [Microbacterium sp. kSW2-24]|uniref:Lsr2 family DNA-binding protein n=1 Tax=Microbacterium galbinum TaxID=2851646 RepID=UPI001FFC84A1|nr:hypothetical protein [Microbacterium galbinum]MCK2022767.1 Lsr2 family protein [Microbacterium galbinum]